ncbi:dTDP-glucose 4,6-dehydratase [Crateriforma conspicua]|nr:dTDP-glucose 4,6-dehydratase [Crateriforma conspicua]
MRCGRQVSPLRDHFQKSSPSLNGRGNGRILKLPDLTKRFTAGLRNSGSPGVRRRLRPDPFRISHLMACLMTTSLITGGSGFIGSHLAEHLLRRGDDVIVVDDLSTGCQNNLSGIMEHPRLDFIEGSIDDVALVAELLGRSDRVFHLAAAVGVALIAKEPIQTIERNVYPTQLILDRLGSMAQRGRQVPCFIASTSEVYGKNPKDTWSEEDDLVFGATTRPRWSYGVSKAIDEFLALAHVKQQGLPIVVGRFFNVVGPRQTGAYGMVLPRFVEAALAGRPLVVHDDGHQVRCFAHVDDIIQAVVKLIETPAASGRVYNIGSDQPVSILDLAKRVIERTNSSSEIQFQSYSDAYDQSFEDIRRRVPDLQRIHDAIGFRPTMNLNDIIDSVANQYASETP